MSDTKTMHFCPDCDNMLFPKEDKSLKLLKFECKSCNYTETVTNKLVYTNQLVSKDGPKFVMNKYITLDPTLPRTYDLKCIKCGNKESVYFTDPSKGEESMALLFVCCNMDCGYSWGLDHTEQENLHL